MYFHVQKPHAVHRSATTPLHIWAIYTTENSDKVVLKYTAHALILKRTSRTLLDVFAVEYDEAYWEIKWPN